MFDKNNVTEAELIHLIAIAESAIEVYLHTPSALPDSLAEAVKKYIDKLGNELDKFPGSQEELDRLIGVVSTDKV